MKLLKLSAMMLAAVWVAGCSSTAKKDGEVDGADRVAVEDRSITSGVSGDGVDGSDFGTEASVIAGDGSFRGRGFDDPSSPLSQRVVYFEFDSSAVRAEDQHILEAHAAYLGANPNVTVRLEGHTDERGSREYNLALGERRAMSIRQALMLQGAGMNQFRVVSFGEERPAVEGSGEGVWQQNRRVEIIYTGR
ncbi:peptidoglycan-associated outer membrane lipoprotein [Methylophaga lonarensis MPL]|uniref:Peptidoglycan-associated lipoprotein n=1 Tax=Methylophaga lonarensis MPL TaxID=1286106 RepID=M7PJW9_9GAMM|nr:peptidoglycan-associated lipoprotein Pal [Methylophaga lonarensis]EMR14190.1 peptidoglycan-associated outer membrane lipoprotein [Methylophaga lonarensis MPL]